MKPLTYLTKKGSSIAEVADDLAQLRIQVFRDFPYLYEGSLEYERAYLKTYVDSEHALLFAVFDGNRMVGATTCIPLSDETADVQEPFLKRGMNIDEIFYLGESILLERYRGKGLGHRFFDEREAHAARFGTYTTTCFCAVNRPDNHPMRPAAYRPNDAFWTKRGYQPAQELTSYFEWTDIGENSPSKKPMTFWIRSLPNSNDHSGRSSAVPF